MPEDPKTQELRLDQISRFHRETDKAEIADDASEVEQHERRRQRAAYLAGKLEERQVAERER